MLYRLNSSTKINRTKRIQCFTFGFCYFRIFFFFSRISIHLIFRTYWKSYKIHWNNSAAERRYFFLVFLVHTGRFFSLHFFLSYSHLLLPCWISAFLPFFVFTLYWRVAIARSVMIRFIPLVATFNRRQNGNLFHLLYDVYEEKLLEHP